VSVSTPSGFTPCTFLPVAEQLAEIRSGAAEILPEAELERKLARSRETGRPLTVKFGADPSAPDLHIGHAVVINKLRAFQRLGHTVVFLIGDFTGMIGDPSGKSKTRKALSREEVLANAETYRAQIFKLLDAERTVIRFNSEWFSPMHIDDFMRLTSRYTVARLLEREDFRKRYTEQTPITMMEMLYPLVQGYDSVALHADVELGGTDQTFNLLVGRTLQEAYGQEPQVILTMPILTGTDGAQKMSKSLGNTVGVCDAPREIFGRTMSIPDASILEWFRLASGLPAAELRAIAAELEAGANPSLLKRRLGRELVRLYHDEESARAAEAEFDTLFRRHEAPEEMEERALDAALPLIELLLEAGLAGSKGEARKLVRQGAVSLDGARLSDEAALLEPADLPRVLKVGKRRFLRLKGGPPRGGA
jgi:tyrosyl-tRNA synthetase